MIFLPLTMLCEIAVHINNNSRLQPLMLLFCTYLLKLCFTQTRTVIQDKTELLKEKKTLNRNILSF